MSQDLQAYLRSRARLGELGWGMGLGLSLALHLSLGLFFFWPRGHATAAEEVKVTWVNLPPAMATPSGGSDAMVEGKNGERLRRVEEVAPQRESTPSGTAPVPATPETTRS